MTPESSPLPPEVPVKKKRVILITIFVVATLFVAALLFVCALAFRAYERTGRTFSMTPFLAPSPQVQAPTEADPLTNRFASPHPLANAMALVPEGVTVLEGAKAGEDVYWVVSSQGRSDGLDGQTYQFWSVNLKTKAVKPAQVRSFGFPGIQFQADSFSRQYGYLNVRTEAGWEGMNEEFLDVIDGTSGDLIATLSYQNINPNVLTELVGGPKHLIMFAPKDPCGGLTADQEVTVTGLFVDDIHVPFKQPRSIQCLYNEFGGQAVAPDFGRMSFSRTSDTPSRTLGFFSLPWHTQVTIDLTESDPTKAVKIEE